MADSLSHLAGMVLGGMKKRNLGTSSQHGRLWGEQRMRGRNWCVQGRRNSCTKTYGKRIGRREHPRPRRCWERDEKNLGFQVLGCGKGED
jgi:hypothetical protein